MKMKNPRAVFIPLLERLMELGLTASDIGHLIGRSSNYTSVCMKRSQTACDLTVQACQQLINLVHTGILKMEKAPTKNGRPAWCHRTGKRLLGNLFFTPQTAPARKAVATRAAKKVTKAVAKAQSAAADRPELPLGDLSRVTYRSRNPVAFGMFLAAADSIIESHHLDVEKA